MIGDVLFVLTLLSALGCGLMGGVFFAFSAFVMRALARLPPAQGIAAMHSINVVAITPLLMVALFGTAAACVLVAVSSLTAWQRPGAAYLLVGSLLYLVGTILVTIVFNVPRNDALAAVDPAKRRWRSPMGRLRHHMDGVEPRARRLGPCRVGIAHHRALPMSERLRRAWHDAHPMPRNPTMAQRVRWHVAHAKACGCRKIPANVVRELATRGIRVPEWRKTR